MHGRGWGCGQVCRAFVGVVVVARDDEVAAGCFLREDQGHDNDSIKTNSSDDCSSNDNNHNHNHSNMAVAVYVPQHRHATK